MEHLEQENKELKDEISRLTALMEYVIVAQNQPSPPPTTSSPQRTVISKITSTLVPVVASSQSMPTMPAGFSWGMPPNFVPEGDAPTFAYMRASSLIMSTPPPVVHILPRVEETIYHSDSSEGPDVYEKMDEMKDQFLELRKELKTLTGKDLFGKSVVELCLVLNVKIPVKFKVPEFEKYKGNTCPMSHLVIYARKMSTQTDNDQLLIHYFQDNLTGVALRWYMGLDSASVRTFNDLGDAFVKQYKYNFNMAPNRDQLQSMSQKDKETFKKYAQIWREFAAQISPPLEDKEMTKIFLKTLSSFYYEHMISSDANDFTKMVNMRMRLEEGVREGRLSKDEASSSKKYVGSFSKRKEGETNAVSVGRHKRPLVRKNSQSRQHYHQVSSSILVFTNNSTNQSIPVQQQHQQQPQQRTNNKNNNHHQNFFLRGRRSLLTLFQ
ncbi:uncharacterized protein LOC127100949 isoform X1 [Lathyrus oleraceus]|uniref:uncharacterized protein LOC127100949 isoform X1 n=1 Tax=Pisum sativum TaxID=3888 RepID=UPI0021CEE830|nr:uncharacterized protein LOC127100949 isoform X1 [Pisum sativum]XP_050894215.1 uncharacterized protein LOC127100949 isoform X1 [Pisum sativum]XP_050894216.1 uncharacterized protein LOC127100949 isoform X1 [Pisum sativum]XP_050894217.1 uncharacterized protein LOC127100949 isoform X1 [Pisum sativum]XP_050894218.1 uncharacterized protein LOC127100949 isoform X1 [Pisum sativum]XP_050894220.1 uncharacterized protein LOC127100949 isoform X1 [Pisum sativum]